MSALTHVFTHIKLSLNFDGITIYHDNLPPKVVKDLETIPGYITVVRRDDDEHNLFHRDSFNRNNDHWHFEFCNRINRATLSKILDIFIWHRCMLEADKNVFMRSYNDRYQHFIAKLNLTNDKYKDAASIINLIRTCEDNDLLVYLHKHLLDCKFDYLRARTGRFSFSFWRGTNKQGQTVETSRSWAMIEKTLSLQMGINICNQASRFTPQLAAAKSEHLAFFYPFIKIARYFFSWPWMGNSSFEAFSRGDEVDFKGRCDKHFKSL